MNLSRADILIVEDNPHDLELTLHVLRREPWVGSTTIARDGEEALDFLFSRGAYNGQKNNLPRFILLDLKLPKVNGFEVLKAVKENQRTQSIPVVVFTSSSEECDLTRCYDCGANSYIQKPVNFDDFRKTIDALGSYWMKINEAAPAAQRPDSI